MTHQDFFELELQGYTGLTLAQRRALCDTPITLDGVKAHLTGALQRFAVVVDADNRQIEYSWGAVARIMAQGTNFVTRPTHKRKTRR